MNATRHHALVAAIAVTLTGSLAAANHFRWKDQAPLEAFVVPQQHAVTTDTAPAVTTDTAPAVTCASTMDDLRHGRLGPFAFHDMEENVLAAIDSDDIWLGRHVLVVHAQRDGGNHPPSRTLVIGCEGDQARALLETEGIPSIDGAALKIESTNLLSNDSNCCPSLKVTRTLVGSGDQLLETEPRVEVAVNGHANAIADASRYAGRYVLATVAGAGTSEAPMEDFVLQPDGFFFARHGQDYEPPYVAGTFDYGTWQPSADGTIALKPMRGSEIRLTSGTEEDVLTLDTNHGIFTYSPPGYPRSYWSHPQGAFQQTGAKEWGERNANGEATFSFVEQARTPEYVELYDASRGCGVRLNATEALVRCANFDWTQFYRGKWDVEPGD